MPIAVPTSNPINAFSPDTFVASQIRDVFVRNASQIAEGAPRELGVGHGARVRITYRNAVGEQVEHITADPTRLLHELTAEALARGEQLDDLEVSRPTLEEVYLELTADV